MTTEERLSALEDHARRTDRKLRIWQAVAMCCLVLAGGALLPRAGESAVEPLVKPPKTTQVKAPFQVVSAISHRVLLSVTEDGTGAQLMLGSALGHPSMTVSSTNTGPVLQLYSLEGTPNMNLTPDDLLIKDWNIGGSPSLDLQHTGIILTNSHGVASTTLADSQLTMLDPYIGGLAVSMGGFHFPNQLGPAGQVTGRNLAVNGVDWSYPPF